jgi:ribonuclease P protein component
VRFTKKSRLADNAAISRVFERPDWKVQNASGVVLVRSNGLDFSRLVVIVGKKNVKRAIDRNRTRRVVKACFQKWVCVRTADAVSADFVFIARRPIKDTLWQTDERNNTIQLWLKVVRRFKHPSTDRFRPTLTSAPENQFDQGHVP